MAAPLARSRVVLRSRSWVTALWTGSFASNDEAQCSSARFLSEWGTPLAETTMAPAHPRAAFVVSGRRRAERGATAREKGILLVEWRISRANP